MNNMYLKITESNSERISITPNLLHVRIPKNITPIEMVDLLKCSSKMLADYIKSEETRKSRRTWNRKKVNNTNIDFYLEQ